MVRCGLYSHVTEEISQPEGFHNIIHYRVNTGNKEGTPHNVTHCIMNDTSAHTHALENGQNLPYRVVDVMTSEPCSLTCTYIRDRHIHAD